ncbi:hypothetical protein [Amycolatopsis sp. cmx-11-51]|uniref:hypothetical protein n=1 Tax=Amycolatopsis sp. cmx-11-51 TaxID=2785797 RepID=UPI0039E47B4E
MNVWAACVWGMGGGLVVEMLELYRAVRRAGGLPWRVDPDHEPHPPALLLAAFIRMGIGGVLAAAMASGGQIGGGLGALATGIAAPLLIDQLGQGGGPAQVGGRPAPTMNPPGGADEPVDAPLRAGDIDG